MVPEMTQEQIDAINRQGREYARFPAPITDAGMAELDRLHAAATPGEWLDTEDPGYPELRLMVRNEKRHQYMHAPDATWCAAIHNAYPAIRARLDAAEIELQGWRHERAMTLTAFAHIRDGGDPALIGHPGGSVFGDALRDMLQKRLDAAGREREEYQEATQGRLELVRQLDVLMNGEEGAARQAALCDIVAQFPEWLAARDGRTPAQSLGRIKAAALREAEDAIAKRTEERPGRFGGYTVDDARRDLLMAADRLEAENG